MSSQGIDAPGCPAPALLGRDVPRYQTAMAASASETTTAARLRQARGMLRRGLRGGPGMIARRALYLGGVLLRGDRERLGRLMEGEPPAFPSLPGAAPASLLAKRFIDLRPIRVFPDPAPGPRLTLITDSLGRGSLFGGVATAVVLAAMLAPRLGRRLRIVTRHDRPGAEAVGTTLAAYGVSHAGTIEFQQAGLGPDAGALAIGPDELILTTSWWTTRAALGAVAPDRILYLIQEDERLFYAAGDDLLRCSEVLADRRLRFIVNTAMLQAHLASEGFAGIAERGVAFEPAFPPALYRAEPRPPAGPRRFFFYARPGNPRNLFWRGLEAISAAIERGVLPPEAWAFDFAGKDIPEVELPGGATLRRHENLSLTDYAALVRSVDIGLSLMATPHPSYPPLDLAASGAVAVTNRFGRKTGLEAYSRNILCVEPDLPSLIEGIAAAVRLADDAPARARNLAAGGLSRDWPTSFAPVLDRLAAECGCS